MTEAFGRLLQTEEGRNQARQLIHAHENDDVDSKSTSAGSEISCDSEENFYEKFCKQEIVFVDNFDCNRQGFNIRVLFYLAISLEDSAR